MKKVILPILFASFVAFASCTPDNDNTEYTEDNSVMGDETTMEETPDMEKSMGGDSSSMNDAIGKDSADMDHSETMMDK